MRCVWMQYRWKVVVEVRKCACVRVCVAVCMRVVCVCSCCVRLCVVWWCVTIPAINPENSNPHVAHNNTLKQLLTFHSPCRINHASVSNLSAKNPGKRKHDEEGKKYNCVASLPFVVAPLILWFSVFTFVHSLSSLPLARVLTLNLFQALSQHF